MIGSEVFSVIASARAEKRLSLGVFGPILEPESKLFLILVTLGSKGKERVLNDRPVAIKVRTRRRDEP
jgi:hypothetical protein